MTPQRTCHLCLLALAALVAAAPASAVDGVIEINQASAIAGGITPSDQPGFPVTIGPGESGSFRLSGNLSITDANTVAISVTTVDVTIDLNGFTIDGPTVCTGIPPATVTCVPENTTAAGIHAGSAQGLSVRNGIIRNMPYSGIVCGRRCSVRGVRAIENGWNGVNVGAGSIVTACQLHHNGRSGLAAGGGQPPAYGSLLSGNVVTANGQVGIAVALGDVIEGNVARGNGSDGIEGHTFLAARNASSGNMSDGIRMAAGLMAENDLHDNDGFGANVTPGVVALAGNSFLANQLGPINGTPSQIGANACGNAVCP
jgi:hypothetical protein